MNATNNEVLIRCKVCATSCAPWLSQCRKCGANMDSQAQSPAWSDGLANRELLDSLDAIGGAGEDLADQEMFKMLDEIELLTNEKIRAGELLRGTGQAMEPKLNAAPSAAKTAMLAEQVKELTDLPDTLPFVAAKLDDPAPPNFSSASLSKPTEQTPEAESVAKPVTGQASHKSTFGGEPEFPKSGSNLSAFEAISNAPTTSSAVSAGVSPVSAVSSKQPDPLNPSRSRIPSSGAALSPSKIPKPELQESREVAPQERIMELSQKKAIDPEKFLPPDFFDPRDRKPPSRWGRWLALALVIGSMSLLAGYLVLKNFKDTRPAAVRGIGDLTKPAAK